MTKSRAHERWGVAASAALFCLLALSVHNAWALELTAILDNTAVSPPSCVAFTEERHMQMMKEPLILTGYLEYLGPGQLRKVIETPFEETFIVDFDMVSVVTKDEVRELGGIKRKPILAMMKGIEAILAGQADQLETVFDYQLSGVENEWSLRLTPKSKKIAKQLTELNVTGDDTAVNSMRFDFKGGDWHVMDIRRIDQEL